MFVWPLKDGLAVEMLIGAPIWSLLVVAGVTFEIDASNVSQEKFSYTLQKADGGTLVRRDEVTVGRSGVIIVSVGVGVGVCVRGGGGGQLGVREDRDAEKVSSVAREKGEAPKKHELRGGNPLLWLPRL